MLHIFYDICIVVIDIEMLHAFDKAEWKWLFSKRNLVMYLVRLNLKTNEIVQKKKKTGGFGKN